MINQDQQSSTTGDSADRVSEFRDALQYVVDEKNTEGDCYEFVARMKARAYEVLVKWDSHHDRF